MLKKLKKAGLLSMALLMCFSALKINQVNAQSKGAYIKELKPEKHYYYDINNDGKKEDIYYSTDYSSYNEKAYFYLYINNKMVKSLRSTIMSREEIDILSKDYPDLKPIIEDTVANRIKNAVKKIVHKKG